MFIDSEPKRLLVERLQPYVDAYNDMDDDYIRNVLKCKIDRMILTEFYTTDGTTIRLIELPPKPEGTLV